MKRDLQEGRKRKKKGIARVNASTPEQWKRDATRAIRKLAYKRIPFTSEDVCERAGRPHHPNAVGARMSAAARQGIIKRVGFVQAERPNQHAALISQWVGTKSFRREVQRRRAERHG